MTDDELREERLRIDKRRLELDEEAARIAKRFWHRNLATVITAIVSIAAVVVSATQIRLEDARTNRQDEIAAQRERDRSLEQRAQREKDFAAASAAEARALRMEIGKFVVEHKADIQSENDQTRESARQLMLAIFPSDIVIPVFERLQATAPHNSETWKVGIQTAERLQPQIKFRVANVDDQIGISINGRRAYEGGPVESSTATLQPGENEVAIDVFNKASFRGGGGGSGFSGILKGFKPPKPEGWRYAIVVTLPDGSEIPFSDGSNSPSASQFGKWFRAATLRLQVDPTTGAVTKL